MDVKILDIQNSKSEFCLTVLYIQVIYFPDKDLYSIIFPSFLVNQILLLHLLMILQLTEPIGLHIPLFLMLQLVEQ